MSFFQQAMFSLRKSATRIAGRTSRIDERSSVACVIQIAAVKS